MSELTSIVLDGLRVVLEFAILAACLAALSVDFKEYDNDD